MGESFRPLSGGMAPASPVPLMLGYRVKLMLTGEVAHLASPETQQPPESQAESSGTAGRQGPPRPPASQGAAGAAPPLRTAHRPHRQALGFPILVVGLGS